MLCGVRKGEGSEIVTHLCWSQMVIALSSLVLTASSGYTGGNLRPFITREDTDVSLIADAVKRKRKVPPSHPHCAPVPVQVITCTCKAEATSSHQNPMESIANR